MEIYKGKHQILISQIMEELGGHFEADNGGRARIVISASEDVGDTLKVDRMLPLFLYIFY